MREALAPGGVCSGQSESDSVCNLTFGHQSQMVTGRGNGSARESCFFISTRQHSSCRGNINSAAFCADFAKLVSLHLAGCIDTDAGCRVGGLEGWGHPMRKHRLGAETSSRERQEEERRSTAQGRSPGHHTAPGSRGGRLSTPPAHTPASSAAS